MSEFWKIMEVIGYLSNNQKLVLKNVFFTINRQISVNSQPSHKKSIYP